MDSKSRLLYWLLDASRGGPTRLRIIKSLALKPVNMRQLALSLNLDYKTVQGHIELLLENGIVYQLKPGYGAPYFISPEWEINDYFKELTGEDNGKK
ncbi:MAG: winged helix-turn-helix domain-containing protein [Candidatus Micrarchaeota archaeon]